MTYSEYEEKEKSRIERNLKLMEAGVVFDDIRTAYIDEKSEIGKGTCIGPCVVIENSIIGQDCKIYQNSRIENSKVADGVAIETSVLKEAEVGKGTNVGPFAYLRPGTVVGENCKVGDFVEVKNSKIGNGTKAAHLTYLGDADIGENVNFGCGVVMVNYDGKNKFRTEVGNGAFVGCNVNLVSPVKVGDGAYIGAGSTITKNIPTDALSVERGKQKNIEGWAKERGLYRK